MHAYTVWSPDPGAGSTTLAANLARAHAEAGMRVLTIDVAPPGDGLTALFGAPMAAEDGDSLVDHLLEEETSPFEDLVVAAEPGVDLVPTHPHLDGLEDALDQNAMLAELSAPDSGYRYPKSEQLHRVLTGSKAFYEYDLLILDAAPGFGQHAYNAAYAAPSIMVPTVGDSPSQTALDAVEHLEAETRGGNLSLLGAVRNRAEVAEEGEKSAAVSNQPDDDTGPVLPVSVPDAPDVFVDAREHATSVFELGDDGRDGESSHGGDLETVRIAFEILAEHLAERLRDPSTRYQ